VNSPALLEVENLSVEFAQPGRRSAPLRAVDGVSFSLGRGETLGLVGESGSGKSTIGRAILGLEQPCAGTIRLGGEEITGYMAGTRSEISRRLQVIFQDPFSSLNPARTVGRTLAEPLELRGRADASNTLQEIQRLLDSVGLPKDAASRYPHGFSGGQRQRIAIARSLASSPEVIICDEAVSALDLVTRAQVLNLLTRLQKEAGLAFLFIAHDLPIVSYMSQRTVVVYRGRVAEQGPSKLIHERPLHPYTRTLIAAVPVPVPAVQRERRRLRAETSPVSTANAKPPPAVGCPFAPRCPHEAPVCWSKIPDYSVVEEVTVACHLYAPDSGHPGASAAAGRVDAARVPTPTTREVR
jgi:oligopeptide/dipeptide ABC transporter ATP-binding protein